jgi:hypothetical protein
MNDFQLISSDPTQRSPEICPYGLYLSYSMSRGGSQGFYWFLSYADAAQHLFQLSDLDTDMAISNDNGEPLDCTFPDMLIQSINEQQCAFTVRWTGHVDELLSSQSRFAREIRADFGYSSMPDSFTDMREGLREAFLTHLGNYAERFPERAHTSSYAPKFRNWL